MKEFIAPEYIAFISKEIQTAYLESYSEYGQNIFDRYITYADLWIQDQEYRNPETGEILDHNALNDELEKIEKPAGISNPKDFRHEVVNFVLRARAANQGKNPAWNSYEKLRLVIEKNMFLQYRGPATRHFLQRQVLQRGPKQTQGLCRSHDRTRLHGKTGTAAIGMVPAGTQVSIKPGAGVRQHQASAVQGRAA